MPQFLFVVATFLFGVFIAYFFSLRQKQIQPKRLQPTPIRSYTRAEVAKHNRPEDLWVIIKNKEANEYRIYDLTTYVEEHPGGEGILNHAGGDSTDGFHGPQHPPRAFDILDDFYIGTLVE